MTEQMKYHPLAAFFPMLPPIEFQTLKESIASLGQLDPIVTYDGKILDGRNRYEACIAIGKTPKFRVLTNGIDPLDYVMAANFRRRSLRPAQKVMVLIDAGKYAPSMGRPPESTSRDVLSMADAASLVGVSVATVQRVTAASVHEDLSRAMRLYDEEVDEFGNGPLTPVEAYREHMRRTNTGFDADPYKQSLDVKEVIMLLREVINKEWESGLDVGKVDVKGHIPRILGYIDDAVERLGKFKVALEERYNG